MNKTAVLALIAGLLGGMLTRYIAPPIAFAQNQAPTPAPIAREIRAQSFTLLDQSNQLAATFPIEPAVRAPGVHTPRIVLRDSAGNAIWSAGAAGVSPLSAR